MSEAKPLVLDTNVLSSFETAGWFDALGFWDPEYRVVRSEMVWTEFTRDRERGDPPDWLSVESVALDRVRTAAIGQLSRQDWSCVALVEAAGEGRLVTNDRALFDVTAERGHDLEWGTAFAIETFERCGISAPAFEAGVEPYVDDLYLPTEVADELRDSEKPG